MIILISVCGALIRAAWRNCQVPRESPTMDGRCMKTIARHYRVDRRQIAFLKFIFEAYDGVAVLTTLDADAGIVVLRIPPGCDREAEMILREIEKDILIEPARV